ncbi:NAC domain-containing protein 100-like [Carya illinoinensis]|uniref:NAC domain-containing protein 100-like n=1 Tax=Carya illinoinensis TaxID=32201 RepID=UPI001C727C9C|nr:NAC domain-containing protein 100-like [Carya illinoinensis]
MGMVKKDIIGIKNEWVICKIFKKILVGKKTHVLGLGSLSSYAEESHPLVLPRLINSSMYNNETRICFGETFHLTYFSNSMEDHKIKEDMVESFDTPLLAVSFSSSPSYISSTSNSFGHYSNTETLHYPDTLFMHEQYSVLRMLLEKNALDMKRNANGEFLPETSFSTKKSLTVSNHKMAQRSFKDQESREIKE